MNRRALIGSLVGGVATATAVCTWPFRVCSFPSELRITNCAALPQWHGWHAFRRGLATTLHALGVEDREIQAILRHSNIGITQAIYIKSVSESQTAAMDTLSEKLGNDLATRGKERVN
jgi:hypothetical protein